MALAAVEGAIALVGPATEAVTKIIDLARDVQAIFASTPSSGGNSLINIGVGIYAGGNQNNFGGDGLIVSGYDVTGRYIGTGHMPSHMNEGEISATILDNSGGNGDIQAIELMIQQGGSDAVCVQWIELFWMDNLFSGWTGDFGEMCDQDWYFSNSYWGTTPDGKPYRPNCMWIDGGKGKKHPLEEFSVNMEYILANSTSANGTATYCKNAFSFSAQTTSNHNSKVPGGLDFGARQGNGAPPNSVGRRDRVPRKHHPESLPPYPTGTGGASPNGTATGQVYTTATGTSTPKQGGQGHLVISNHEKHSAVHLCEHPNSRGPDFISLIEELFCDMTERIVYPLCSKAVTTACFSYNKATKKVHKRDLQTHGKDQLHRTYHTITKWGTD